MLREWNCGGLEQCDGGNTTNGYGCSSTCHLEAVAEVKPKGTNDQADVCAVTGVIVNGLSTMISGAITPALNKDIYKMTLAQSSVVRFETFDSSGNDCTAANVPAAMKFSVLDFAGSAVKVDSSTKEIGSSSGLVLYPNAGTY
jgi:cysteine-rich repeat protein